MVKFRPCAGAWSIIILGRLLNTSDARLTLAAATSDGTLRRNPNFYYKHAVFSSSQLSISQPIDTSMAKPDSTSWIQSHLGALYEAQEDDAFASAFGAIFSPDCEVRLDHTLSTVDTFKESVSSRIAAAAGVTLSWENVIATSDSPDDPSVVAGTLIVTRTLKFRIRAAPAQRQTHINFSTRLEQQSSVQADENDDRRRVTSFYYTSVDKTPPIHFATPNVVSQENV